jgi:hypothetical protein
MSEMSEENIDNEDQMLPTQDDVQVRLNDANPPPHSGGKRIVKEVFSQRVSPNCTVQVSFDGPVTQRAIEKLIAHLNLAKDDYPQNGGPE